MSLFPFLDRSKLHIDYWTYGGVENLHQLVTVQKNYEPLIIVCPSQIINDWALNFAAERLFLSSFIRIQIKIRICPVFNWERVAIELL